MASWYRFQVFLCIVDLLGEMYLPCLMAKADFTIIIFYLIVSSQSLSTSTVIA